MRDKIYRHLWLGRAAIIFGTCSALALLYTVPLRSAPISENSSSVLAKSTKTIHLPKIVSVEDERNYRRIFTLQEKGKWREAEKLIRKLSDGLLLGHVMAQRYLHPTKYRSRYLELSKWLKSYADHPDARRIYKLALRRKPAKYKAPRRPENRFYPPYQSSKIIENSGYRPNKHSAKKIIRQVRRMTYQRRLTAASRYIFGKKIRQQLGRRGMDLAKTHIASGWFFYGNGQKAYELASSAASRSGELLPYAHWIAGLSAYRLKKYLEAARHFEAVALSSEVTGYDHAAAAFWAARSNMTGGKPLKVSHWLRVAAQQPRAFYGILARRWLGERSPLNWTPTALDKEQVQRILTKRSGRRAAALIQVGQTTRAERELRFLANTNDNRLLHALIAVAEQHYLPMVSYRAAAVLMGMTASLPVRALYPLPNWEPREGYRVDRALIFAFIRQESAFNVRAKSYAGARGLMQLMPATAGFIARKRFRGSKRNQLYDPALNISLGQKYIEHLLENDHIDGDLLMVAAAYNGGPGNLRKWQKRARKGAYTDALMFIESIPARETRIFIERVLSNLWMYRERLGEPAPSLDALAAGKRPTYVAVDGTKGTVTEDVWN